MSTFGEGSQVGEETAAGGDQQQHSMGQISRLLGRPKCFSGREDEWHDWSFKFGATAATLSDHASVWMNGALHVGSTGSGSCADFRATDVHSSHSSV